MDKARSSIYLVAITVGITVRKQPGSIAAEACRMDAGILLTTKKGESRRTFPPCAASGQQWWNICVCIPIHPVIMQPKCLSEK